MKIVKDIIMPVVVLTVICLVVSAALAFTYQATKPVIDDAKQAQADAARALVLPGAESFAKIELAADEEVYREENGLGFVITAKAKGYGGDLVLMVGIDNDGTIAGVKVIEHAETPGFGAKLAEDSYGQGYAGKTGDDYADVAGIAGSTVTSKAYKLALKNAYSAFEQVKGDAAA